MDDPATLEGTVTFVTDPICSWCWGTLPEILIAKNRFAGRLAFNIRCAGLQVGSRKPLNQEQTQQLIDLWQMVAATTSQQFGFSLPTESEFIYHSELACRALQIVRDESGSEPWNALQILQHAFYVKGRNISDLLVLFELLSDELTSDRETFNSRMISDEITTKTRTEFDWCKNLETQALPAMFLDQGGGPKLLAGGYITAEFLIPDIENRLSPLH